MWCTLATVVIVAVLAMLLAEVAREGMHEVFRKDSVRWPGLSRRESGFFKVESGLLKGVPIPRSERSERSGIGTPFNNPDSTPLIRPSGKRPTVYVAQGSDGVARGCKTQSKSAGPGGIRGR